MNTASSVTLLRHMLNGESWTFNLNTIDVAKLIHRAKRGKPKRNPDFLGNTISANRKRAVMASMLYDFTGVDSLEIREAVLPKHQFPETGATEIRSEYLGYVQEELPFSEMGYQERGSPEASSEQSCAQVIRAVIPAIHAFCSLYEGKEVTTLLISMKDRSVWVELGDTASDKGSHTPSVASLLCDKEEVGSAKMSRSEGIEFANPSHNDVASQPNSKHNESHDRSESDILQDTIDKLNDLLVWLDTADSEKVTPAERSDVDSQAPRPANSVAGDEDLSLRSEYEIVVSEQEILAKAVNQLFSLLDYLNQQPVLQSVERYVALADLTISASDSQLPEVTQEMKLLVEMLDEFYRNRKFPLGDSKIGDWLDGMPNDKMFGVPRN